MIDNRMKAQRRPKDIWFPWYPGDYASKTAHLTMVEDSAYRRLLDHYYQMNGSMLANATILLRVCRAFDTAEIAAVPAMLSQFFTERDGYYHHERADVELEKRAILREKRAQAGSKGGQQKAAARVANATILLDGCYTQHNTTQQVSSEVSAHVAIATKLTEVKKATSKKVNEPVPLDMVPDRPGGDLSPMQVLTRRLCDAMGTTPDLLMRGRSFTGIAFAAQLEEWKAKGVDPEADVWPVIAKAAARAKAKGTLISSPRYFEIAIFEARDNRLACMPTPAEAKAAEYKKFDEGMSAYMHKGWWHETMGPKPDEPGCKVPPEILQKYSAPKHAANH
jgi:uncharacterized protein YdaU (DUF1376 family)